MTVSGLTTYQVVGVCTVLEHKPGEVFQDRLDEVQEARLVGRHLRIVTPAEPIVADVSGGDPWTLE